MAARRRKSPRVKTDAWVGLCDVIVLQTRRADAVLRRARAQRLDR